MKSSDLDVVSVEDDGIISAGFPAALCEIWKLFSKHTPAVLVFGLQFQRGNFSFGLSQHQQVRTTHPTRALPPGYGCVKCETLIVHMQGGLCLNCLSAVHVTLWSKDPMCICF